MSDSTKFTSGTWHASATFREVGNAPGIDIGASNGTNLATVHYEKLYQEPSEVRANATLFAASKDLYATLNALLMACVIYDEQPDSNLAQGRYLAAKDDACHVLLKARGETSLAQAEA
jgi:hypothetical protein